MPQPQQLPGPNADIWDWQMARPLPRRRFRRCSSIPTASAAGPARSARCAPRRCAASCPVIAQCRTHALAVGEPYGIWGGLSESERELLLKRGIRRAS